MHGRPQVQQPLRLGAYAMQLVVDAAVVELELRTPADFPLHKGQGHWSTPSLPSLTRCPPFDTASSILRRGYVPGGGHLEGNDLIDRGTIRWPGVWRLVRLRVVVGGWDKPRGEV